MTDCKIHVLAGGGSSVGGFNWYFVGLNYEEMYVVTRHHEYSKDDRAGWLVREYSPGQTQDEWKVCLGAIADKLIEACKGQPCPRSIDWTDKSKIRNLYWEYKK